MNKKFLNDLMNCISPSGREDAAIDIINKYTANYCDKVIYDNQGSITTVYNSQSDYKVMLVAHCDEISLVVNGYNVDGSLTVTNNGGVRPKLYIGSQVHILTDNGIVNGVVGTNSSLQEKEKVSCSDLFIDVGCKNVEQAMKLCSLGSYIVHASNMMELSNNLVSARAFDDRLGVFITQSACLKAKKEGAKVGIYCTASAGEETTSRGAYSSSAIIKPDVCVVVDVTYSTDYNGANASGCVELGQGGVICLGSIPNRRLNDLLKISADEVNAKIQYEVWPGRTSTDGDTIIKSNDGVPTVLFSIPLRYMHSPVEVASYEDIESMINVLSKFLCLICKDYPLLPYIKFEKEK